MLWFLVFLLSAIAFFIVRLRQSQTYWKRKGIRYDVPVPFFGMMLDVLIGRKAIFECMDEIYRASPDARYVGFYQFTRPVLLLRDPELIKQIFIKDFDVFPEHRPVLPEGTEPLWTQNIVASKAGRWKGLRSILSPAFTSSKMKIILNMMEECSRHFVNHFISQPSEIIDVELKDVITRYANDVIGYTTFGLKVDSLVDQNNEFYRMGKAFANFNGVALFTILFYSVFATPMKFLDVRLFPREASSYFTAFFKEAVKHREEYSIKRPDMLHLLLQARKNEESKNTTKGLNITDEEIAAQAMIFFLGGFETVSTSLCFAIYELAVHQDVQERLRQEVDGLCKKTNGIPSFEDVTKMKYLDMVISENLRKNPPMILVDRRTVRPYTIEPIKENEKTITLRAGEHCLYSLCSLHWDEKYFPNAKKFDPERFSDENKHKIIPGTYIPFGMGPRTCLGARFATLEIKSLLFHLIRNFEVIPNKRTDIPLIMMKDSFTLTPKNGFHLSFKKRQLTTSY